MSESSPRRARLWRYLGYTAGALLVLRSIRLDDLDLAIRAGGGPALREIPMLPEVVRAGPVEVELGTVELRRARLVYDDPANGMRIRMHGMTASLRPGRDAMSATVTLPELVLDAEKLHERVEQLEAEVR